MTPVSNQPLLFTQGSQNTCCQDVLWNQRMFDIDFIRWQFELEPCANATELIADSDFSSDSNWILGGGATISGGMASLPNSGDSLSQITAMPLGVWLEITINIASTEINATSSKIKINGFDNVIFFTPAPGTFTFQGQSLSDTLEIFHNFSVSELGTVELKLDSFSVKQIEPPTAEIQDVQGNTLDTDVDVYLSSKFATFQYQPIQDVIDAGAFVVVVSRTCGSNDEIWTSESVCVIPENDCDIQIGVCASSNVYGDDFQPIVRLKAELRKGTGYQSERFVVNSNTGKFSLGYGRRDKVYLLNIPLLPEHMRDFIYFIPMCNSIAIREGSGPTGDYFVNDEPDEPSLVAGTKDLTNCSISLVRKQALEESIFTGDCNVSLPPYVIGERDLNIAIQTDTDELING